MIMLFFLAFILQQEERSPTLDVLHTSIINTEDFNASAQKICGMYVSVRPINWFSVVVTHHDTNHLEFVSILDPTQPPAPRDHAIIIALCQLLLLTTNTMSSCIYKYFSLQGNVNECPKGIG